MYYVKSVEHQEYRQVSQKESEAFEYLWNQNGWCRLQRRKAELARKPGFLEAFDKNPLGIWRKMVAFL